MELKEDDFCILKSQLLTELFNVIKNHFGCSSFEEMKQNQNAVILFNIIACGIEDAISEVKDFG